MSLCFFHISCVWMSLSVLFGGLNKQPTFESLTLCILTLSIWLLFSVLWLWEVTAGTFCCALCFCFCCPFISLHFSAVLSPPSAFLGPSNPAVLGTASVLCHCHSPDLPCCKESPPYFRTLVFTQSCSGCDPSKQFLILWCSPDHKSSFWYLITVMLML